MHQDSTPQPASPLAITINDVSPTQKKRGHRLLVLDGGGMRGLATVRMLRILAKSGIKLQDFDMIGGTSAGGLIALAALLGLTLDQIEDMFQNVGQQVFTSSWAKSTSYYSGLISSAVFQTSATAKHDSSHYKECLRGALRTYGDPTRKLGELGKLGGKPAVFAVASDISFADQIRPYILRSYQHSQEDREATKYDTVPDGTDDMTLIDAALATSTAPTYFDSIAQHEHHKLVDGGLGFNNPITLGIHELKRTFGWDAEVDLIVSIGTGLPVVRVDKKDKSVKSWSELAVNIATEGDLIHNNFQLMRPILTGVSDAVYARFNPPELGSQRMDDASEKARDNIELLTTTYMKSAPVKKKLRQIRGVLNEHQ